MGIYRGHGFFLRGYAINGIIIDQKDWAALTPNEKGVRFVAWA